MTDFDILPSPDQTRRLSVPARTLPLGDGRHWGLALPTSRYRPEVVFGADEFGRPIETIKLIARTGYSMAIHRLIDDLRSACRPEARSGDERRRFDILMALAVALLRRAHDLTLIEAVGLLDLDGEGLCRLVDAVLATVDGVPSNLFIGSSSSTTGAGDV